MDGCKDEWMGARMTDARMDACMIDEWMDD